MDRIRKEKILLDTVAKKLIEKHSQTPNTATTHPLENQYKQFVTVCEDVRKNTSNNWKKVIVWPRKGKNNKKRETINTLIIQYSYYKQS